MKRRRRASVEFRGGEVLDPEGYASAVRVRGGWLSPSEAEALAVELVELARLARVAGVKWALLNGCALTSDEDEGGVG